VPEGDPDPAGGREEATVAKFLDGETTRRPVYYGCVRSLKSMKRSLRRSGCNQRVGLFMLKMLFKPPCGRAKKMPCHATYMVLSDPGDTETATSMAFTTSITPCRFQRDSQQMCRK
jgi:hypothetical protein